jgi:hypothetical protein
LSAFTCYLYRIQVVEWRLAILYTRLAQVRAFCFRAPHSSSALQYAVFRRQRTHLWLQFEPRNPSFPREYPLVKRTLCPPPSHIFSTRRGVVRYPKLLNAIIRLVWNLPPLRRHSSFGHDRGCLSTPKEITATVNDVSAADISLTRGTGPTRISSILKRAITCCTAQAEPM